MMNIHKQNGRKNQIKMDSYDVLPIPTISTTCICCSIFLDVNSLVVRKNHLEAHRLLIFQQSFLIQRLQHSIRIASWERDRLKYAMRMNLKDY
jgi:hypothetical protein